MAKRISAKDIFENEDVFKGVRTSAENTIKLLEKINGEFRKTASTLKSSIGGAKFDSSKAINEFIKATQKANQLRQQTEKLNALQAKTQSEVNKALQQGAKAQSEQNKANQQAQKVEQEKQKTTQQSLKTEQERQKTLRETNKTQREQAKEAERQAKAQEKADKATRDANSAYKQLERNTRELKNQSKELGAQLLKLEADGKKNTAQYRQLAQTYQQVTQKAQQGDQQLKKLDKTVGDNFRSVGNYRDALGGLQNMLGQLGIAFGVQQVFQNITSSVTEFQNANSKLNAVLGTTPDQTQKLVTVQRELGRTTSYTAGEVGKLQVELAKLGFTNRQIEKATEGVLLLAKASGTDLPRSAEVAGATLRGFTLNASEMDRVVNVMAKSFSTSALDMESFAESMKYVAPIANQAGLSIEETSAMLGVLANQGVKGSQAGTSLRRIITDMAKTGKPAKEALMEVVEGGITLTDAFDEVGRTAMTALTILGNNMDGVSSLTEQYVTSAGAVNLMAKTMDDNLTGAVSRLSSAWEGFVLDMDSSTGASKDLQEAIDWLANNLVDIMNVIMTLVKIWVKWKIITLAQIGYNKLLASSFIQTTRSIGGLSGVLQGTGKLLTSIGNTIKNNIVGIAVVMIAELYFEWKKLNDIQQTYAKNTQELNQASEEITRNLEEEKAEVKALFDALKKTNKGSDERKNLMEQINGEYGTTLKNMDKEIDYIKQVDKAQKDLIATLEKKAEMEMVRTMYEISGRQLGELKMAADEANRALVDYRENTSMAGWIVDNLFDKFGATTENELLDVSYELDKQVDRAEERYEKYKKDYLAMLASTKLKKVPTPDGDGGAGGGGGGSTKTPETREYAFELSEVNRYLSQQIELLQELETVYQDAKFTKMLDEVDGMINTVQARAKNRAIEGLDPLDFIIPGEMYDETEKQIIALFDLAKQTAKQRTDFEISQIDRLNQYEKDEELKTINENYAEQKKRYAEQLKDLEGADPADVNKAKSKANLNKALADLDKQYQDQLKQLDADNLKRDEDAETKKLIEKEKLKDVELNIEKDKNAKINEYNDQLNASIEEGVEARAEAIQSATDSQVKSEEEALRKLKERWETMTEFVKQTTDFFIQQSDRRIEQYQKEKTEAEGVYEDLRQLAINGNIDAQKSLAEQQRAIDEYNKKIQREEKRQQRLKLASTAFESYNKNVQNLEPGQKSSKALADTIRDITLLTQFVNALPTFYDGTEDTGTHGQGVDGRGGFKAILHPNERVIPKKFNKQIGADISNEELTKLAVEYKAGRLVRDGEQTTSALNFALLVNKLDEVNQTIKNKPESYYGLGEVTQSMVEIIDQKKKGNTVIYNRYRIKK